MIPTPTPTPTPSLGKPALRVRDFKTSQIWHLIVVILAKCPVSFIIVLQKIRIKCPYLQKATAGLFPKQEKNGN